MTYNHGTAKSNGSGCKCRKIHENKRAPLYLQVLSNTWPAVPVNHNFLRFPTAYTEYPTIDRQNEAIQKKNKNLCFSE